jgi:exodeoxyribonuclease-5
MSWSPQQEAALRDVSAWLKDPDGQQVFRLFGYAGTGKTTLAKHLAQDVNNVLFGAYTGKAAHVLQQKGCPAQTIHSLIYLPKGKSAEKLRELELLLAGIQDQDDKAEERRLALATRIAVEKENMKSPSFTLNLDSPVRGADLVIIDECSMVGEDMAEDLLHFGSKVLVLGDPAQLPPVRGSGYFTNATPDVLLTEIHRQAKGNPIIDLATIVRQGGQLETGWYGDSVVTDKLDSEQALAADQIIVGRNKTRHMVNRRMRELLGFSGIVPCEGERLVCLRNNHELGLLNGSIWIAEEVFGDDDPVPMEVRPEDETWRQAVLAHRTIFNGEELEWYDRLEADEFDYGYALTCHKSQGSQWGNVMIIDESYAFRAAAKKWLYTAITRAADSVVVKI